MVGIPVAKMAIPLPAIDQVIQGARSCCHSDHEKNKFKTLLTAG
jgi:hypothetical protein